MVQTRDAGNTERNGGIVGKAQQNSKQNKVTAAIPFSEQQPWLYHLFKGHVCFLAQSPLPLTFPFLDVTYSGSIVCAIATLAAIQEGHFIRTKKKINSELDNLHD